MTDQKPPKPGDHIGAIDCGSNAIRFSIFRLDDELRPVQVHAKRYPVRLGAGTFSDGKMAAADMDLALEAFAHIKNTADEHKVMALPAVATSAIRDASNAAELVDRVEKETGICLRPISGEEEAELIAEGVNASLVTDQNRTIFDVGGGSTEVVRCSPEGNILHKVSLPLGAVRLAQEAGMPDLYDGDDIDALRDKIGQVLQQHYGRGVDHGDYGVAVGGTARAVAQFAAAREIAKVEHLLSLQDVVDTYHALVEMTPEQITATGAMDQSRAMIILPGTLILMAVMAFHGLEKVFISNAGVREGLVNRYLKQLEEPPED